MGQTCFMSVILQTLIHNPFIRNYYLSEGHRQTDCEKEACVSCSLDEMFVEFYSSDKNEGYGAVSMLMGSWLAGEVSTRDERSHKQSQC
jgi:ubiquitin carboxyl-terminal hydrolase 22/27/51